MSKHSIELTVNGRRHCSDIEALHPVQQVLIEEHGSQCGFCTPGSVMTLAALTNNDQKPTEEQLIAALSGNVYRGTGYQGIRRAAKRLVG